nr:expressed protein [Hymenolepis microstoma]
MIEAVACGRVVSGHRILPNVFDEGSTAISIAEAGGNEDVIRLIREKAAVYKSDLTYHVTNSSHQLFEPRTFQIVSGEEAITEQQKSSRP